MDCPPGQKKSGRCGGVAVSGGSTVSILNVITIPILLRPWRPHESAHFWNNAVSVTGLTGFVWTEGRLLISKKYAVSKVSGFVQPKAPSTRIHFCSKTDIFFPPVWPTVYTYLVKMVTDNASQKLSPDCRVFGSIWKYRMQCFSWRTCTVRAAGTNVECRMHQLLRVSGGRPPGKFLTLDSLECNFLHSLDRKGVTRNVF